jgi:hypothetical protein
VYADDGGWFWWPWAERIAATDDPLAAAWQVTAALRGTAPARGAAVTGPQAREPTLAEVRREYPGWECARGISGMYHAEHAATGIQVTGEDALDLRDQIKAAEARLACAQPEPGAPAAGQAGTP